MRSAPPTLALALSFALWTACSGQQTPEPARGPKPPTAATSQVPSGENPGKMVWPKPLQPGDTIMFVAPASELDRERMLLAQSRLEERGYRVVFRPDLFAHDGYLAGSDQRRADELMEAFRDPKVAAIFPGTGGYGTMRMLDLLDFEVIRANPKVFVGFSDITALHAALNQKAGLITFHSPNPMYGLGSSENLTAFSAETFFRAIERRDRDPRAGFPVLIPPPAPEAEGPAVPQPRAWGQGKARGKLVGGNLSLISALEGTPYAIDTRDAILLLEDTREAPYRVDRMLRQLQLAGKLASLRGAVLGQFTHNYAREDETRQANPRFTVDGVLEQYFGAAGIPVLMNFPIGHDPMNATLPLGAEIEIDADAVSLRVLPVAR